jgi:hypothetical protein
LRQNRRKLALVSVGFQKVLNTLVRGKKGRGPTAALAFLAEWFV